MHQIKTFAVKRVSGTLPPAHQFVVGKSIVRKHVDVASPEIIKMRTLDKRGRSILNLSERKRIVGVVFGTYELKRFRQPFGRMRYKLIVVRTRHSHVKVIVPRNKTLVANCPNHRPITYTITQSVLGTHLVKGQQYVQNPHLESSDIVISHYSNLFSS